MTWWKPSEIVFSRLQVLWLVENRGVAGEWPVNEAETGYTDMTKVMISPSRHAYFERPCQVYAELDYRIKKTGVDGKLLVRQIQHEELYLEPEAKSALNYICGYERKRMKYRDWKRQRRYRLNS